MRAIADVATAVTQGDLTRSIQVDVRGELADLKDNMNAMIGTLRATTESNREQDWLKTNLAKFSDMMQGQRDQFALGSMLLSELAPLVHAQQGVMYVVDDAADAGTRLRRVAGYAHAGGGNDVLDMREGLVGQCATEGEMIVVSGITEESTRIRSGLLELVPRSMVVLPVMFEGQPKAVIGGDAWRAGDRGQPRPRPGRALHGVPAARARRPGAHVAGVGGRRVAARAPAARPGPPARADRRRQP